jgi:hypothetical protein
MKGKGVESLLKGRVEKDVYTTDEFREIVRKRVSKYGNMDTEYNGVVYDSKKEAQYAYTLDRLLYGKFISKWERQIRYNLAVNGVKICAYVLDFKVYHLDGYIEYVDIKGMKKGAAYQMFKVKQKLMLAILGIDVIEK